MKCKQCGWENPDNYDRCVKCNNVLSKPRTNETPAPGYEADRPVNGRTSGSYGGYTHGEYAQPYDGRPYTNRPDNSGTYGNMPPSYHGATPPSYHDVIPPSYNDTMPPSQQQPYGPAYSEPSYGHTQQNPYDRRPIQEQYAPQPEAHAEERYCPECDAELPDGASECPVCHTRIVAETIIVVEGVCPDCGVDVTPVQKFCHNCGARLMVNENNIDLMRQEPVAAPGQPVQQPGGPMPTPGPEPVVQPQYPIETDGYVSAKHEDEAPASYKADETDAADDTVAAGPLSAQIPECELRMFDADGSELRAIGCAGDEVELYRSNTDPANNTIARDIQAKLTFADGKWSIEDCSALQTTFVRPVRKMELRDGDIIVMGNREFMFKS